MERVVLKTLLRLTRHAFLEEQRDYLEKRFGVLTVIQHPQSVTAEDMRKLRDKYQPDLVEVVLPFHLIGQALEVFSPVPVIKAVMKRTVLEGGRIQHSFSHYEQIKSITVDIVPL